MDLNLLQQDPNIAADLFHKGKQAKIWTALPGVILSYNNIQQTCVVQPAIQGILFDDNMGYQNKNLPPLLDVPVCFPSGGGCTLSFPIVMGDECLVVFSSRCIDGWWIQGVYNSQTQQVNPAPQMDWRQHDLSDAIAYVGIKSVPNVPINLSTTTTQLRTIDGTTFIELNPTNHTLNLVTANTGSVNITTPTTTLNCNVIINGNLQVNGTITASGDIVGNGISLDNHVHSGVTSGSSNTGAAQG